MHPIDFQAMEKEKSILYESMWGSEKFQYPVEKTGETPNHSYLFAGTANAKSAEDVCEALIRTLSIAPSDQKLFREKFKDAGAGGGREWRRIATLHSSSLCAFLFFFRVKEHPYTMTIEGEPYVFTDSFFEYQNPVIDGGGKSNIDVVLVGTKAGKPVVLFLESKFSEYLSAGLKSDKISGKYRGHVGYSEEDLARMGLEMLPAEKDQFFLQAKEKRPCYLDGIKQMISHYIGVKRRCEPCKKPYDQMDAVEKAIANGAKVLLGEILFELPFAEACLKAYQEKYERLAEVLNDKRDGIEVLPHLLTYSQFRDRDFIPDQVKEFYFRLGRVEKFTDL